MADPLPCALPTRAAPIWLTVPLTVESFGRLLGALASRPGSVPKYLYPSAGTLYPVQAYVVLRRALGDLPAGSHAYDPEAHALVWLSAATPAAPDGSEPDALLLVVAETAAIEPIYGAETMTFCLLEAGYIEAALRVAGDSLRLREAGDPADSPALVSAFALAASHVPLTCWTVGEAE